MFNKYINTPKQQITTLPKINDSIVNVNKIENIALSIGQGTILMGADVIGEMAEKTVFGNNFSIYIEAENKAEMDARKEIIPMLHTA